MLIDQLGFHMLVYRLVGNQFSAKLVQRRGSAAWKWVYCGEHRVRLAPHESEPGLSQSRLTLDLKRL